MTRPATVARCGLIAMCALALAACGGGGGSVAGGSGSGSPPPAADNVVPVVIDDGPVDTASTSKLPIGTVDTPFVSITLCVHGSATCQTIDHISVDTGSTGLRVVASALSAPLAAGLTQVTDAQGQPLGECLPFADGYSWGAVRQADVQIGGEQTGAISVQVIGDPSLPNVPSACSSGGATQEDTVTTFGGNGILGIAAFKQDCGTFCVTSAAANLYFDCPTASTCTSTTVPLASQVWNPVARLPTDNNGTILALDQVPATGAIRSGGSLILGIDTQNNNQLGAATVLSLYPTTGELDVTYNSQKLTGSIIDSGSNGYYFSDSALTVCTNSNEKDFYCPATTQALTAIISSSTGIAATLNFNVANADTLFHNGNGGYWVFNNLAGTATAFGGFDIGLPFFLGRRVYTAVEQSTTSAGPGPFVAY